MSHTLHRIKGDLLCADREKRGTIPHVRIDDVPCRRDGCASTSTESAQTPIIGAVHRAAARGTSKQAKFQRKISLMLIVRGPCAGGLGFC
jgi:hypothetical protein